MAGGLDLAGNGPGTKTGSESEKLGWLGARAILFCFLLNMLDGADVLVVSYAAPGLGAEWKISPQTLGLLFSAGLAGMTAGALFLAPLSDKLGRKTMVLFALAVIGLGMIASAFVPNIGALIAIRLFVGLGIGSMLATVTSLASEFAPPRYRSLAVTFATAGYPLGAVLAGVVAAYIIPAMGWRSLFLVAGIVSTIIFPLCLALMPESLSFLLARQPKGALASINKIHRGIGREPLSELPGKDESLPRAKVSELLGPKYRRTTLLIWSAFFATFSTLYFLTSWIPKIASDAGLPIESAIYAGASFNLGAMVGVILLGWLTVSASLTRVISWFFLGAFLAMLLMGRIEGSISIVLLEFFIIGFFVQGGFGGLYAVAARNYPTTIRTTGVGWGLGAGRLGAVIGPFIGGQVIGAGASLTTSFLIFAIPLLFAAAAVAATGEPESEGQALP